MGSADSGGKTHSGGGSCGFVSSLFPNSCRGRAESFARRLHRRLTSLGGEVVNTSEDEDDDSMSFGGRGSSNEVNETSWLHAPTSQKTITTTSTGNSAGAGASSGPLQMEDRVLDSQPRHSPESEVFYDFDVETQENEKEKSESDGNEDYATTSPAEIASEADLANIFVNRKIGRFDHACNATQPDYLQDSESGCVYASPLSGTSPETDNSEIFFDPESSETERTCENQDTGTVENSRSSGSGSVASDVVSNEGSTTCKIRKHPLRRRLNRNVRNDPEHEEDDDTSESSSSSANPELDETKMRVPETRCTPSPEESLNGNKSSLETTTSPSHESLWSTFDESTLSLQDEPGASPTTPVPPCLQKALAKSHSDSEITGSTLNNVDEVDHLGPAVPSSNGDHSDSHCLENNISPYCSSIDVPGALVLECSTGRRIAASEKSLKNQVNLRIEDTNGDPETGDMTRLLERLATSPHVHHNQTTIDSRKFYADEEKLTANGKAEDETCGKNGTEDGQGGGGGGGGDEEEEEQQNGAEGEEEEEEDDRPQRLRRCSSLKTGKTPPGTPGRKKIVRFADVLGLDLADVRTFLDEIPKIPNSAYSDLIYDETFHKDSSPVNFWGTGPATFTTPLFAATMPRSLPNGIKLDRILVPLFQQPGGSLSFLDQVRERLVCLENVVVEDPINLAIHGTVRVRNLDFHKSVHVRYTLDSWRSFSDLQAIYVPNSCDGFSDKFNFHLYCHTLKIGQRLELAVRFQCKGSQYWDNNSGVNYCFQCLPATSNNTGYIPITTATNPTAPTSQSMPHCNPHDWSPTFY
ncbi:uncharacterized protein [Venturia canescens]|nr:uncharacterized protein LOC122405613 isoform X2 [Venturia canescens]XP_043266470.1 uncharacterized protein LOC122405613 isoform X2 [Venturia canescens]XP_043266471.1 uncharacterized protein LOC122405613 isoform X2 [Venturia canescens]XP_043266472.1 uncharacterized protein LOC122405613 isoform X2 [Venturia canescens]XP_043266473.1 uncharacterized protein LOC122405613 isoform X2 [Venturia canescens]XP_043266474.1 uncharacterized protein LOC122405613 isoform X2 [Venturia canescens]XP_04326647